MGDWRSRGRIVTRTKCLPRSSLYSVFRLTAFLWVKLALTRIVPPLAVKILIPKSGSEYRTSSPKEVAHTCSQTSIKLSSCWTFNTLLPYLGPRAASLILPCLFHREIVLTMTWRISATSNLDLPFASKEKARSRMHWAFMLRTADRTTGQMPKIDFSIESTSRTFQIWFKLPCRSLIAQLLKAGTCSKGLLIPYTNLYDLSRVFLVQKAPQEFRLQSLQLRSSSYRWHLLPSNPFAKSPSQLPFHGRSGVSSSFSLSSFEAN